MGGGGEKKDDRNERRVPLSLGGTKNFAPGPQNILGGPAPSSAGLNSERAMYRYHTCAIYTWVIYRGIDFN